MRFLIKEIPIDYRDRPEGSESKLNIYKDGLRVIRTIISLFKDYKPLPFFSILSLIFFVLGILVGIPVVSEFILTRYITKMPSAVLAVGIILMSLLFLMIGLILDTLVKNNRQNYELSLNLYKENRRS